MVQVVQAERSDWRVQVIRAAVLGSPITHSLSPALHKRAYELLGLPASYGSIDLTPERALDFFKEALIEDWTGFSLTMPLKESIFDLSDSLHFEIEPVAVRMRSANTILKVGDTFRASSTDRTGFIRLLDSVKKDRVAVIGGGGTARAALGALDGKARNIDFLLRNLSRAEALSTISSSSAVNFYGMDRSLQGYDLVISTVPAGASDLIAESLDFMIPTVFEVLYNPYPTKLLTKAITLGSNVFDGIDLLVEQALDQIALFSGTTFDLEPMRQELLSVGRAHLR